MKHKILLRAVIVVVLLIVLLCMSFMVAVAYMTAQPFSYGFWSGDETKSVQNFLVAGVDKDRTRTDLILFCQCNLSDNSLNILQIPRDTKVDNDRFDKKINSAYGTYGKTETLFDEIQSLIGLRPDKYVIVGFDGFRKLIDEVGGVEIDVPMRMYYTDPAQDFVIDLYPGRQVLDGRKAEMFMRFRQNNDGSGYPDGDIGRINAQRVFYDAVIDKLLSAESILNAHRILGIVKENVITDFDGGEILKYVERIPDFNVERISVYSLPGEGGYDEKGVSYFFCDKEKTELLLNEKFGKK